MAALTGPRECLDHTASVFSSSPLLPGVSPIACGHETQPCILKANLAADEARLSFRSWVLIWLQCMRRRPKEAQAYLVFLGETWWKEKI